jgi:hypothetical protein
VRSTEDTPAAMVTGLLAPADMAVGIARVPTYSIALAVVVGDSRKVLSLRSTPMVLAATPAAAAQRTIPEVERNCVAVGSIVGSSTGAINKKVEGKKIFFFFGIN